MSVKRVYTNEMFDADLKQSSSGVVRVGECDGYYTKVLVRYSCGHEAMVRPYSIIELNYGCIVCNPNGNFHLKSQKDFEDKVAETNSNIEILGEYKGVKQPVKIRWKTCGHEYEMKPDFIYKGHTCKYCSSRALLVGFNDIATTTPWMTKYLADKEDAHRYMCGSKEKILFKCPDCGTVDEKQIGSVHDYGFACHYCSDGISYPNKFGRAMLKQLPVENVLYEYLPKWSQGKKYDNYFEYNGKQYVLEMDGGFHFRDTKISPLEQTLANDKLKDDLAVTNGLTMIRINCRYPEKDYVVENIKNSLLNELFDLSNIDWDKCEEWATSNLVKEACLYYEAHKYEMTNKDIAKLFGVDQNTLKRYRNIGESVGWCEDGTKDLAERKKLNKGSQKPLDVYDSEHNFIGHFDFSQPCAQYMTENYGQYFAEKLIRRAFNSNKPYHGFYFVVTKK